MFRKWICALLVGVMLLTLPAMALAETQYATVSTPTSDGSVYVRSSAGAGQPVIGSAKNGDQLIVLKRGNTWHKVQVVRTGVSGWMYGSYIKFGASGTTIDKAGTVSSSAGYANFRTGAGTEYSLISKLTNGTKLQVITKTGSWYYVKVKSSGKYGYISASLVSVSGSSDSSSSTSGTTMKVSSSDGFANLRKGPGTSYSVVRELKNGTKVDVISTSGSWSRVEVPSTNQYGYVYTSLLTKTSSDGSSSGTTSKAYTTGCIQSSDGFANFRTGAGTKYSIIARLNNGVMVSILSTSGSWYKVQLSDGGATGYVSKSLVEKQKVIETLTTTGNVNMRSGPGTKYSKMTTVPKGTAVSVMSYHGDYAYVNAKSWIGYIHTDYLH